MYLNNTDQLLQLVHGFKTYSKKSVQVVCVASSLIQLMKCLCPSRIFNHICTSVTACSCILHGTETALLLFFLSWHMCKLSACTRHLLKDVVHALWGSSSFQHGWTRITKHSFSSMVVFSVSGPCKKKI